MARMEVVLEAHPVHRPLSLVRALLLGRYYPGQQEAGGLEKDHRKRGRHHIALTLTLPLSAAQQSTAPWGEPQNTQHPPLSMPDYVLILPTR